MRTEKTSSLDLMLKNGSVRDAIVRHLKVNGPSKIDAIYQGVCKDLQTDVPRSSVRSYLRLNEPEKFSRTAHGTYKLR